MTTPPNLRNKPLTPANSIAELRVSNGQARYFAKNGKLLGLHLADVQLTDEELAELLASNDTSALEVLHIARNAVSSLTLSLPKLKFLDARGNKSLITADLSGCPQLEKVVLSDCALSELILPESLPILIQLEVANNALTELLLSDSLGKLRFLDVSNNQLTELPNALVGAKDDFYLLAEGNRFKDTLNGILNDKELSDEARWDRLKFQLNELKTSEQIKTSKLIFLGNTQVGKTTLTDILTGERKADEGSTHGVNIFEKNVDDIKVIGIDFGGQDYYHNVHFPLFNEEAIYVLLWGNGQQDAFGQVQNKDSKEFEDIYPIDYWLGAVEYFMRSSNGKGRDTAGWKPKHLNLYLLNNRKLTKGDQGKWEDLNNKLLKERNGVDELVRVCLADDDSIGRTEAKELLFKLIKTHSVPHYYTNLNVELEKSISEQRAKKKVLLSVTEFQELNEEIDADRVFKALPILSYSVACHFLDTQKIKEDAPFREVLTSHFIIDLEKFTKWLYRILTIKELRDMNGGYFQKADAKRWLKYKSIFKHLDYILGFMLHHKIIFVVKGETDRYVVPQYLKPLVPNSVDGLFLKGFEEPLVKYRFESYFHSNILSELIAQCYASLLQPKKLEKTEVAETEKESNSTSSEGWKYVMWKNKVVLYNEKETTKRFLLLEFQLPLPGENSENEIAKPTITLSRYAKEQAGDKFVQDIMKNIEETIKYYETTKLVKAPNGEYIPFSVLEVAKARIAESGYKGTSENQKESNLVFYEKYVYRRGDFKLYLPNERTTMKKIFISYSQHDESYKDELKKHLVTLIHENKVSTFDDRQLSLGGEWDSELKRKIDECDIMICLISVDFLNTGYIMKTEVPRALEMGKIVVHIVVRPCDWAGSMLGVKNGVLKAKEISLFEEKNDKNMPVFRSATREERDMFWLQVVKEFRDKAFVNEG